MKKTLIIFLSILLPLNLLADDSEIYFSGNPDPSQGVLMFSIDNSISLNGRVKCEDQYLLRCPTRRDVLSESVRNLVDDIKGVTVAFTGFHGGRYPKGAVVFPRARVGERYCDEVECDVVIRREVVKGDSDAVESSTGDVSISSKLMGGEGEHYVGIHFSNFQAPQSTLVNSGELSFELQPGNYSIDIQIQDSKSTDAIQETHRNISNRWNDEQPTLSFSGVAEQAEDKYFNVHNLIQNHLNRNDWCAGQALTVLVKINTGSIASFENNQSTPPRFEIKLDRSVAGTCPKTAYRSYGEDLVEKVFSDEVDNYIYHGSSRGTYTVDAALEAFFYLTGRSVEYGRFRSDFLANQTLNRISHTDSYVGGDLTRNAACDDAHLSNSACIPEKISGRAVYKAASIGQCSKVRAVVVTDGELYSGVYDFPSYIPGAASCTGSFGQRAACQLRALTTYMGSVDQFPRIPGDQFIPTDIIGLDIETTAMRQVAEAGGGNFYFAQSVAGLTAAFDSISNQLLIDDSNVAFNVQVNAYNQLTTDDNIYFALFQPALGSRWQGNIKKYQYKNNNIVGQNNALAVGINGYNVSAKDFWASGSASSSTLSGGATSNFTKDRKVFVDLDPSQPLNHASNSIKADNKNLTADLLGVSSRLREKQIDWILGKDTEDYDQDKDVEELHQTMGGIVHSNLVVANYGANIQNAKPILFSATSDGFLHAFNAVTGQEEYVFIPKELLPQVNTVRENQESDERPHGIDGQLTTWYSDLDGNGYFNKGDASDLYLLFGLRRSGETYYALDISTHGQPSLHWKFSPKESGLGYFGQSWSKPQVLNIKINNEDRSLVLVSGGYDPANDTVLTTEKSKGAGLALIDIKSGNVVWSAGGYGVGALSEFDQMKYSIPATPRVLDLNSDGFIDRFYVGDLGGQLWRFDIHNGQTVGSLITGGVIAAVADPDTKHQRRRFFSTPDVSIEAGGQMINIAIGSGWASHPLDQDVNDKFYLIRDDISPKSASYTQVIESDLYDATSKIALSSNIGNVNLNKAKNNGWYLGFSNSGEKVVGESLTADGNVIFGTYIPSVDAENACSSVALGSAKTYLVSTSFANPIYDINDDNIVDLSDRFQQLQSSLLPSQPQLLLPGKGEPQLYLGTEKIFDDIEFSPNAVNRTFHSDSFGN
ncbi:pilus assembly protein [Pelagibaculum spongiae]|uniref:PilY1 beta-propeller domain-containing protein n=1 Tax=Pelagibaculum spongiae TaxID=2080658 RepID=A0A2V1GZS9_9GAMM|nr:PilC/PilY family type IV pilus protein [Pelagibaculum spongiae]PVZ70444.1 hypothetical protein DC094_07605 [Pelagibaculum spongiae]